MCMSCVKYTVNSISKTVIVTEYHYVLNNSKNNSVIALAGNTEPVDQYSPALHLAVKRLQKCFYDARAQGQYRFLGVKMKW